jgi:hypothetical protein
MSFELVMGCLLWLKFCGGIWCGTIFENKSGLAFFLCFDES